MTKTKIAWILFIGGLVALYSLDYYIRYRLGITHGPGGLPEILLLSCPLFFAAISTFLLYQDSGSSKPLYKRLLLISLQVAIGFIIYLFISFYYVIYIAEIDAL